MKLYAAILMAGLLVAAAASADYLGKVTAVVDGDTRHLPDAPDLEFVRLLDPRVPDGRAGRPPEQMDLRGRIAWRKIEELGYPFGLTALWHQVQDERRPRRHRAVRHVDRRRNRVGPQVAHGLIEDGGVLATPYAAHATILITDNLKDFAGQDAETFQTSHGKTPNGTTRELYCVIRSRPDRKELVIVHPADFVSWTERDFRISPQSIRRTFARTPKP